MHNMKRQTEYNFHKPKQADCINLLKERDIIACLRTGYGKSLIFETLSYQNYKQIPTVLIVSPLNSIITEQLQRYGKDAVCITTGFIEKLKENQCVHDTCINREEHCVCTCDLCRFRQSFYRFVIGHPEHILNKTVFDIFKNSCWQEKVTYIIVDEAHCIEKWGNDFRKDYKKISQLRSAFPFSRVLALTGTATQKTCETIEKSLCLKKVHVVKSSIVRDNIKLLCEKRPSQNTLDSFRTVISPLISDLRKNKDKFPKTVVYSKLKWCAEGYQLTLMPEEDGTSVCEEVKTIVSQYHAPCTEKFKEEVVEQMNCGSLRLLFATEAYSMGTDAPDIRQVVHYGVPSSLETYLQEVGRAGRDGKYSKATLYYNKYDIGKNMPVDQEVRDFVTTSDCRWENLCTYFGSEFARKVVGHDCCDNCEFYSFIN